MKPADGAAIPRFGQGRNQAGGEGSRLDFPYEPSAFWTEATGPKLSVE